MAQQSLDGAINKELELAEMLPISKKRVQLNNETYMPYVGFGTYRIRKNEIIMNVVDEALSAGYRMFDTAAVYGNEIHLKKAFQELLPKYDLDREDIFITTKLSPSNHGGKATIAEAYKKSLDNLGLDYIDLYLIHFPGTAKLRSSDLKNKKIRMETWEGLAQLYDDGLVNAIGVSNFTVNHLKDLMRVNHGVVPAVNQVEWHPFYHQTELLDYCKANDIVLQAYCSLGGASSNNNKLLEDPVVQNIARNLEVSSAQVLLAWALQHDVAIIPKSTNPVHIKQNIALDFKISEIDMKALNELGKNGVKYAWDPSLVA